MKYLKIIILLLLSKMSFAQNILLRADAKSTVEDFRLSAKYNLIIPRFFDTTEANAFNGIDSAGAIIFSRSDQTVYFKSSVPKKWVSIGTGSANFWSLLGATVTDTALIFMGSINNKDVIFRRNNLRAGLLGTTSTSFGNGALKSGESAASRYNTAFGLNALTNHKRGSGDIGIGDGALRTDTSGTDNFAGGSSSQENIIDGVQNTSVGNFALQGVPGSNHGKRNIAIGFSAGKNSASDSDKIYVSSTAWSSQQMDSLNSIIYGAQNSNPLLNRLAFNSQVKINDGSQGNNYIFTSDANGYGTWKPLSSTSYTLTKNATKDSIILSNGINRYAVRDSQNSPIDTTSINNRINAKLNIGDTFGIRMQPIAGNNIQITGAYPFLTFRGTPTSVEFIPITGTLINKPVTGVIKGGANYAQSYDNLTYVQKRYVDSLVATRGGNGVGGNDSAYIKFTVLNDSNIVFKRINGGLDTLTLVGNGAGGGGGGTALNQSQIGFGSSTNTLTGSPLFQINTTNSYTSTNLKAGVYFAPNLSYTSTSDTLVALSLAPTLNGFFNYGIKMANQYITLDNFGGIAIGSPSTTATSNSVSLGKSAGGIGASTINIGVSSGFNSAGNNTINIGEQAGAAGGGAAGVNIGTYAGYSGANANGVLIGFETGTYSNNNSFVNALGNYSMRSSGNSSYINSIGVQAGFQSANASYSNYLGYSSGSGVSGSYNNLIGYNVGLNSITGSNNTVIGSNITTPTPGTSNTFNFGNVLYGTNTYSVTSGTPSSVAQTTGQVGINVTTPNASAVLDVVSTSKGFLTPRMTTTQRDAITTPANGLQIYNLTDNQLNYFNGTVWQGIGVGSAGGGGAVATTQYHTTGTTVTIANTTSWLIVNPTSVLSSLAITMPATPTDGQEIIINFGGTISTTASAIVNNLLVVANTGQGLVGTGSYGVVETEDIITYKYNLSLAEWFRK